jgi:hypothetical protein
VLPPSPGQPFLLCWLAIPWVSAHLCMREQQPPSASINWLTSTSLNASLACHRHGFCQFCLVSTWLSYSWSYTNPEGDLLTWTPCFLKMTRNNHIKWTKRLQINWLSLAPLTAKIWLQSQDLQKTYSPH